MAVYFLVSLSLTYSTRKHLPHLRLRWRLIISRPFKTWQSQNCWLANFARASSLIAAQNKQYGAPALETHCKSLNNPFRIIPSEKTISWVSIRTILQCSLPSWQACRPACVVVIRGVSRKRNHCWLERKRLGDAAPASFLLWSFQEVREIDFVDVPSCGVLCHLHHPLDWGNYWNGEPCHEQITSARRLCFAYLDESSASRHPSMKSCSSMSSSLFVRLVVCRFWSSSESFELFCRATA